ncbi:MAG: FliM/FliN family flagellar motor switch protein [Terracidiphilus sp.]|jgi:flagellar motor switch protein FliN
MKTYLDYWAQVAADLFSQALAGEPKLNESLPRPFTAGSFGFAATITGDLEGKFSIILDAAVLEVPLMGEGVDQKAGWAEILKETCNAAAGELLAKSGTRCRVEKLEEVSGQSQVTRAFELRAGDRAWTILVRQELRAPAAAVPVPKPAPPPANAPATKLSPGLELLLDVELQASLRFGSREMPLGEILDLGPGDVVQLDRHVADPVDLIVGDKIVARGEVVLVNGNFGLRVTQVAAPEKRLESIRCLF